jgi:hypothetical protein
MTLVHQVSCDPKQPRQRARAVATEASPPLERDHEGHRREVVGVLPGPPCEVPMHGNVVAVEDRREALGALERAHDRGAVGAAIADGK